MASSKSTLYRIEKDPTLEIDQNLSTVCITGYAGWGCTDDSDALSNAILLASVLLLTTSNLFFIPAIILALRRGFYPQALMYFTTMFFSSVSFPSTVCH